MAKEGARKRPRGRRINAIAKQSGRRDVEGSEERVLVLHYNFVCFVQKLIGHSHFLKWTVCTDCARPKRFRVGHAQSLEDCHARECSVAARSCSRFLDSFHILCVVAVIPMSCVNASTGTIESIVYGFAHSPPSKQQPLYMRWERWLGHELDGLTFVQV